MRRGYNVYEEARHFFGRDDEKERLQNFSGIEKPPCIFLSHQSADKAAVTALGEYIMKAGINIYMDINDPGLQAAVAVDHHDAITLFIERGITASTDLMACISKATFNSCWVPYEIGFGKRAEKKLGALRIRDVSKLPSYLNIQAVRRMDGIEELNAYLKDVKYREHGMQHFSGASGYSTRLREEAEINAALPNLRLLHPLRDFLDS